MSGLRRVAGIGLDGSMVTATFGKIEVPLIKASYGDKLEPAFLSFMGSQQQDEQTPGTYKTDDVKLSMSAMVFRTLILPAMPATGGGNVRLPIVVGRTHPDLGSDSDLLENCRITNWSAAVENSNKAEEVELTATVQQIKWTDSRKTINQLRGVVPAGAIGF
jgi:hypothetical protein